jgi:hypothetical protein
VEAQVADAQVAELADTHAGAPERLDDRATPGVGLRARGPERAQSRYGCVTEMPETLPAA